MVSLFRVAKSMAIAMKMALRYRFLRETSAPPSKGAHDPTRCRTNRWTGAAGGGFLNLLVRWRVDVDAPPGQLNRYAVAAFLKLAEVMLFWRFVEGVNIARDKKHCCLE